MAWRIRVSAFYLSSRRLLNLFFLFLLLRACRRQALTVELSRRGPLLDRTAKFQTEKLIHPEVVGHTP